MKNRKIVHIITECLKTAAAAVFLIVYLYPVILIFISSVKTKKEMAANPSGLPENITFDYFAKAFDKMNYIHSSMNSLMIVLIVVGILTVTASMTAYAISRRGKRYNWIYFLFMAGMLVPFQMTMIPLYKFLMAFKLINKLAGVVCAIWRLWRRFQSSFLRDLLSRCPGNWRKPLISTGQGCTTPSFPLCFLL